MSSIVTAILRSTLGFLCGKARDSAADKLKDGDIADEKLREIIIQDLTNIKFKLDCLSLKDLDSSYSFLKDGVGLLNIALDTSNEDQKASEGPADEATKVMNDTTSGILNGALSLPQAIQQLKISSDKRFVSAQDCFRASRERATDAFNNKSLNIKDRIMACKLRVAARILELGLEDPVAATTSCLLSLEELHGLPAVQEMFSVYLKGGLKSRFKKAERFENIMSVLFINHALYDFAAKYSSKYPNVFTWPGIELSDRQFNPILHTLEILRESVQQLSRVLIDKRIAETSYRCYTANTHGEIILLYGAKLTVINPSTSESKDVMFPDSREISERKAITVDSNDNVYVVVQRVKCDSSSARIESSWLLYVFDANHNIKHNRVLNIFEAKADNEYVYIAVGKNKNIFMNVRSDSIVYVCDLTGQLKYTFKLESIGEQNLSISDKNEIIRTFDADGLYMYTTEGKSTINLPKNHIFYRIIYHHGICKIFVITLHSERDSYALLCYSEAGELEHSVYFQKSLVPCRMTSHPSGPGFVRFGEIVILI